MGREWLRLSEVTQHGSDTVKMLTAVLENGLSALERKTENIGSYFAVMHKYWDIETLTPALVNEFISKIIINKPDKSSGKRIQKVEIVYNFVGKITLAEEMLKRLTYEKAA